MLDVKLRWYANYTLAEVVVTDRGEMVEMGLLDDDERAALRRACENALMDLDAGASKPAQP